MNRILRGNNSRMFIGKSDPIPSSEITPRSTYMNRRAFMAAGAVGVAALAAERVAHVLRPDSVRADVKLNTVPSPLSATGLTPTSYYDITHYNNFYEFGVGQR